MLLMGTDKSEDRDASGEFGDAYRSDSMMLARIDPQQKKVTLVSIERDTLVDIDGYGINKINAAYALGGPSLAVKTVSEFAGVPISHYAEINFDGFKAVVDALGGVDVNVSIDIDDPEAGGSLSAGEQAINGDQALILCRSAMPTTITDRAIITAWRTSAWYSAQLRRSSCLPTSSP